MPPSPQPALAERSSPAGKGETFSFLMQGASPLASPGLDGTRHWLSPAVPALKGACFFSCWLRWALTLPGGGRGGWGCPPPLPLVCFLAPLPRRGRISPLPALAERSSPAGKGEIFSFLMQGASPLAFPGLDGTRHWLSPAVPALKGGLLFSCWLRWALTLPGGGAAVGVVRRPCL